MRIQRAGPDTERITPNGAHDRIGGISAMAASGDVGQVVLPALPGGSPATPGGQVNVPLARNNDLPYGSFAFAESVTDPAERTTPRGRRSPRQIQRPGFSVPMNRGRRPQPCPPQTHWAFPATSIPRPPTGHRPNNDADRRRAAPPPPRPTAIPAPPCC